MHRALARLHLALVFLLAALLASSTRASGGTSSIAISAWQKHFNEDGTDVCLENPGADVCKCPCDSDLITVTQLLGGAKQCIIPEELRNPTVAYEAAGRSAKPCWQLSGVAVSGVCATPKKCASDGTYARPKCQNQGKDGERCPSVLAEGAVNWEEAKTFCEHAHMRVCSLHEINSGKHLQASVANDCGMGKDAWVWTKTPCDKGPTIGAAVASGCDGDSAYIAPALPSTTSFGQPHCRTKTKRDTIHGKNILPMCCADAGNESPRWNLQEDVTAEGKCGNEVDATQWSFEQIDHLGRSISWNPLPQVQRVRVSGNQYEDKVIYGYVDEHGVLPWNAADTGYTSKTVFSGGYRNQKWDKACDNRSLLDGAPCRTMLGPFTGYLSTTGSRASRSFSFTPGKSFRITLRVWANDYWRSRNARSNINLVATKADGTSVKVLETFSRNNAASCAEDDDAGWHSFENNDVMFEPGKPSYATRSTGGACYRIVELVLSKEQTVSATNITLRAECYSYDPLPWNWDSTERWSIRYAYCGYDMIQAWDSADAPWLAPKMVYPWGAGNSVLIWDSFGSTAGNDVQKVNFTEGNLIGEWQYKKSGVLEADTGFKIVKTLAVGPGVSKTELKGFERCGVDAQFPFPLYQYYTAQGKTFETANNTHPCFEIQVGWFDDKYSSHERYWRRLWHQKPADSISATFNIGDTDTGERTENIRIKFRMWAVDSWDLGESVWLTINDDTTNAWSGSGRECTAGRTPLASDSSPAQLGKWTVYRGDILNRWRTVVQKRHPDRTIGGNPCYLDVDLRVKIPGGQTTMKLDFQANLAQGPSDEWWGFSHLEIWAEKPGSGNPSRLRCPGNGCDSSCLNLPGLHTTSQAMGLCGSDENCKALTWPTSETLGNCINMPESTCVPSPRGVAASTDVSQCSLCPDDFDKVGDFWCARNNDSAWPAIVFTDPIRNSSSSIKGREITKMSVRAKGSMGADGLSDSKNFATLSLNSKVFDGEAFRLKGRGIEGRWDCNGCFESSTVDVDGSELSAYNYSQETENVFTISPAVDHAWCLSSVQIDLCAKPGPAKITDLEVGTADGFLSTQGGDTVILHGVNLGPKVNFVQYGRAGKGFIATCEAARKPYTTLVCVTARGIGGPHQWQIRTNGVKESDPSSKVTQYAQLEVPNATVRSVDGKVPSEGGNNMVELQFKGFRKAEGSDVRISVKVATPEELKVTRIEVVSGVCKVTHIAVSEQKLNIKDHVYFSGLGLKSVALRRALEGQPWSVTSATKTGFHANCSSGGLEDSSYTDLGSGSAGFWPTHASDSNDRDIIPSETGSDTLVLPATAMTTRTSAILGVRYSIHVAIHRDKIGEIGKATTPAVQIAFAPPRIEGGAETIISGSANDTFRFLITGENFGLSGEGEICPSIGDCAVVQGIPSSHKSIAFEREGWNVSHFPASLTVSSGDIRRTTRTIALVKNPPALLDEENIALVEETIIDTTGRDENNVRENVTLVVHGVEEDSLEKLVVKIEMQSGQRIVSLFGCVKDEANCPNEQQGNARGWQKIGCGFDSDREKRKCSVTLFLPEGEGRRLRLWVQYGSNVESKPILFGGYRPPIINKLAFGVDSAKIAASNPNVLKCQESISTVGETLTISGRNFGLAPLFEFCVYNEFECTPDESPQVCCDKKKRWQRHELDSDTKHTTARATIAAGLGKNHLFRIVSSGQVSSPAALCFGRPNVTLVVTDNPRTDDPGNLTILGSGFGSNVLGWADDGSREHYRKLFTITRAAENTTAKARIVRVLIAEKPLPSGYNILVWTDSKIVTRLNPGQGTDHYVRVDAGGELSDISEQGRFSYAAPEIIDVNPKYGPTDGSGEPLTIVGRNFGTPTAEISVTYQSSKGSFTRQLNSSVVGESNVGPTHNHFTIERLPMPAGQGGENISVIVTVSGQASRAFILAVPSNPVAVEGYPDSIILSGPYLPPLISSVSAASGPASGCKKWEGIEEWKSRYDNDDSEPRRCKEQMQIKLTGSSFGLSGSQGDAQVELKTIDGNFEWHPIANATDGNIVEHTHNEIIFNAPTGVGENRYMRLVVGGQLAIGLTASPTGDGDGFKYDFEPPEFDEGSFEPRVFDARVSTRLRIHALDGFGEEESPLSITIGSVDCKNASWKPISPKNGRPFLECLASPDVAGKKATKITLAERQPFEETVNYVSEYNKSSKIFSICSFGTTDVTTGRVTTYYGRPCNARELSSDQSQSVYRDAPCVHQPSGSGETCLKCPEGATCLVEGTPFPTNKGKEYTYYDPVSQAGFWRAELFLDVSTDLSEIKQRKSPSERYTSLLPSRICESKGALACEGVSSCVLKNRTMSLFDSSGELSDIPIETKSLSSMPTCVDASQPDSFDKGFVFDFVPCTPPEACIGANDCGKGYEGFKFACNDWYNKQPGNESRTCRTNQDCMTKSGNSDILSQCSSLRPQDCAVCDLSGASEGGTGTCKCVASPRCGRCTLGGDFGVGTIKSYFRSNGACEECPQNVVLIIALFVVGIFVFLASAAWLSDKEVNMAFIPIGVDYFQVLAIFTGSNIPWPSYFASILKWFAFFNVSIDITAPECIAPNLSYAFKFYLTLLSPVVALVFMGALLLWKIFKQKFCKSCLPTGIKKFDWRSYISIFLIIVYFLFLPTTRRALEVFNCNAPTPADGYKYTTFSDPACPFGLCRCYDSMRHEDTKDVVQRSYIPWSVLFLCVYSAGFPMLVAGILWRNKPFMKQDQLLRAYGYGKRPDESTDLIWRTRLKYKELYYHYKPGKVYWLLWIIYRKLAIAVIALLFYSNPGFQLALTILVLFSSYVLQVRNRPYMSELEKRIQVTFHEHAVEEGNKKHIAIESIISRVKNKMEAKRKSKRRRRSSVGFKFEPDTSSTGQSVQWRKKSAPSELSTQEYFFDYNTVELVLLGVAIVICAAGIMFTSGQFDSSDESSKVSQDVIGTVVVLLIAVSILYYLLVVFVEVMGGTGCAKHLVGKLGRRDKAMEITKKLENSVAMGDVEMAVNPMNKAKNSVDQHEMKRLKAQTKQTEESNKKLMAALRDQKKKVGQRVGQKNGKSKRGLKNNKKKEYGPTLTA